KGGPGWAAPAGTGGREKKSQRVVAVKCTPERSPKYSSLNPSRALSFPSPSAFIVNPPLAVTPLPQSPFRNCSIPFPAATSVSSPMPHTNTHSEGPLHIALVHARITPHMRLSVVTFCGGQKDVKAAAGTGSAPGTARTGTRRTHTLPASTSRESDRRSVGWGGAGVGMASRKA
ncbi:hypothetical protein Vafri_21329, partial [Volvox africanus]